MDQAMPGRVVGGETNASPPAPRHRRAHVWAHGTFSQRESRRAHQRCPVWRWGCPGNAGTIVPQHVRSAPHAWAAARRLWGRATPSGPTSPAADDGPSARPHPGGPGMGPCWRSVGPPTPAPAHRSVGPGPRIQAWPGGHGRPPAGGARRGRTRRPPAGRAEPRGQAGVPGLSPPARAPRPLAYAVSRPVRTQGRQRFRGAPRREPRPGAPRPGHPPEPRPALRPARPRGLLTVRPQGGARRLGPQRSVRLPGWRHPVPPRLAGSTTEWHRHPGGPPGVPQASPVAGGPGARPVEGAATRPITARLFWRDGGRTPGPPRAHPH